ncbi:transcriptional coactivator p15/PC4 family protein [Thermanaeromonas sp. C210]|uniref:transcriptional coactivator p15/PC4 family protein n=1 Tax=Thermanaeromonas sp. C210 TaxID=2731925 RepID=UPI0015649F09|nr:transcriptional coactivator p15/PC4 family protein [Thermanaeromonas sp. C210]
MRVQVGIFKGVEYVDIRVYYYDATKQEWKPSRKGVAFKRELLPEVVKALEEVGGK